MARIVQPASRILIAGLLVGMAAAGALAPGAVSSPEVPLAQLYNVGFWQMPPGLEVRGDFHGAEILLVNHAISFVSVATRDPALFELRVREDDNVRYVNRDAPDAVSALLIPNDPNYGSQYGWGRIDAPTAWDTTLGSTAVTVAIIDTGVQASHPDLGGSRVLNGMTCAGGDPRNDDNGHGTHVAGTAAATTNNGVGVAGASASNILPVKVLNSAGSGTFACVASGITWAADNGGHVLSMSLGCNQPCFDQATSDAINYARNTKGAIVVVAAGNANGAPVGFPGSDVNAFTVSCSTSTDAICSFSSLGPEVDVAAPGSSILSTCVGSSYCTKSGTSMSTPHVSGVAALVKTVNPSWTGAQLEDRLRQTAKDLGPAGFDNSYGHGLLQAGAAVGGTPPPPAQCADGVDNDGDGLTDFPNDPGCTSSTDNDETDTPPPPPTPITLSATGYKAKGRHAIDLSWSGATSTNVDVFRNGVRIVTTANDGFYTDATGNRGTATYVHKVCEAGTTTCSNETTTTF